MPTAVVKSEPKSEGIATPRKKRPKEIAVITECCTGCAGSPACVPYCPVADCMYWVPDEDHQPFGHIEVDAMLCAVGNGWAFGGGLRTCQRPSGCVDPTRRGR